MNLNKKNLWKPMEPNKVKRRYWTAAGAAVLCLCCVTPAMAAGGDPLDIVNNLSDFIFSIIKALGVIILGWGIVQVGMSIQSHDASQRTQGFLWPVWWADDRLCKGNSDRHRRDLIKRAGRYCLAADLPAPLWEVIFIWIITGS